MVEMGQKIKRKTYRFELKKRFQYESHYRVRERPPIERIKAQVRALLTPKKEEKKVETYTAAPPPGGFNFVVFGAFLFIAIIVVGLALLLLTTQLNLSSGAFRPQVEKSEILNTIQGGEILSAGSKGSPQHMAAVLVEYQTTNLNNYTVNISTYDVKIPSEVFILNSERDEATMYPDFMRVLRTNLGKRKIILNEITLKQLESVPEGALIIVPSGTVPKEMLGFDSLITMDKLADRGVVVVYVGKAFTYMWNGSSVSTPSATVSALPVRFDESSPPDSSDNFSLYQPLYRATPGGGWKGQVAYGSVSIITRGDGAFVFVPQTLDGGWRNDYTGAADDISRIVFETPWAEANAEPKEYLFANQTNYSGTEYFFSEPFDAGNATAKVDFIGYSPASNYPVRETLYMRLEKPRGNELFIEQGGKVVSANITSLPVRMNAQLRESQSGQPNMNLVVIDNKGNEVQVFPEGNVNIQGDRSFDVLIYLDRGEYIVKLMDDESIVYTETYMKVVSIDIAYTGNEKNRRSAYLFEITMDGIPKTLSEVSVTVDGGNYGSFTFNDVDKVKVDVGDKTGGELLPLGKHSFDFTAGGLRVSVPVEHTRPPTIFDSPLFWITLILTGGIVGIGAVFARQEEVYFSIDVPDFPPVSRTRIPVTTDTILGIFLKINETYRWQNTPLTPAEIKNGFKDIFVSGKPVYITDYNVEFLLYELEKKGFVRESLGYYGLLDWEGKTGRSIQYLALMRRLRDICVNNAIPFTSIGESKEADSEITVVGQQMTLHFYEKGMDVTKLLQKVIPTIGHGISIVMFRNKGDKEHFQTVLDSSPTVGPMIIKMEADSSSLLFQTADELEKMLIEFKLM